MINYQAFLPEIWLVATAMLILVTELFLAPGSKRSVLNWIAFLGTLGALLTVGCLSGWCGAPAAEPQ